MLPANPNGGNYAMSRHYTPKKRRHNEAVAPSRDRKVIPMSIVRRIPRTQLTPGTVVWAHVPFADGTGEKSRPAVVLSRQGRDIELLPATTSMRRHRYPDQYVEIQDLESAGLGRATGVCLRPVVVDILEIIPITGSLRPANPCIPAVNKKENGLEAA